MQYRNNRLGFSSSTERKKKRVQHKKNKNISSFFKVQMKLLEKSLTGRAAVAGVRGAQHESDDVHSLRLHSTVHEVPHFKQHASFLYCTLLNLCMLDLADVTSPPRFSRGVKQIASLKRHYVHLFVKKIITSK